LLLFFDLLPSCFRFFEFLVEAGFLFTAGLLELSLLVVQSDFFLDESTHDDNLVGLD